MIDEALVLECFNYVATEVLQADEAVPEFGCRKLHQMNGANPARLCYAVKLRDQEPEVVPEHSVFGAVAHIPVAIGEGIERNKRGREDCIVYAVIRKVARNVHAIRIIQCPLVFDSLVQYLYGTSHYLTLANSP